ncbi:alpha/beta hydrolase [Piscinibacter koreensis]|nr:hypothetical protein [Schlegelella koreensis]
MATMTAFRPRTLRVDGADVACLHLAAAAPRASVLWVFGSGGGFHGPAGGLYDRLGAALAPDGVTSLQVAYRRPGELGPCVADVLGGVAALVQEVPGPLALVGHSFGGAVVIRAAVASPWVTAVAALSSQAYGTERVGAIAPRPIFLLHGTDDEVLPAACSQDIHSRAGEPKLLLQPRCRHGLDECRDELDRELGAWLRGELLGA